MRSKGYYTYGKEPTCLTARFADIFWLVINSLEPWGNKMIVEKNVWSHTWQKCFCKIKEDGGIIFSEIIILLDT